LAFAFVYDEARERRGRERKKKYPLEGQTTLWGGREERGGGGRVLFAPRYALFDTDKKKKGRKGGKRGKENSPAYGLELGIRRYALGQKKEKKGEGGERSIPTVRLSYLGSALQEKMKKGEGGKREKKAKKKKETLNLEWPCVSGYFALLSSQADLSGGWDR